MLGLTVSSQGANQLTFLPPEIVRLTSLRELNVSSNKLQYLPSEMLSMRLTQLNLHPNPFSIRPPTLPRVHTETRQSDRSISPSIHPLPRVIPLIELCFRVLLSRYMSEEQEQRTKDNPGIPELKSTVLAARYPLPLTGWRIPPPLEEVLDTCAPGSIPISASSRCIDYHSRLADDHGITGLGVCPSPQHGAHKEVFVRHAEERYTWERIVAGVNVGGAVPVLWRGCQWGCLDFLDVPDVAEQHEVSGSADGSKMDAGDVVNLVRFESKGCEEFVE